MTRKPRNKETIGAVGRTNIRTVALLANVSISTVSRAMNHVGTVNPKMAKRVYEVVEKLKYLPNTQARAIASGRSRLIGLVVSEMANPSFPELIHCFEDIATEYGYEILVISTGNDERRISLCIRRMLERNIEGVAVMTFGAERSFTDHLTDQLIQSNIPLVFIDDGPDRPQISLLKVNYRKGIRQSIQHLAALGHRKVAFVSGPKGLHAAASRYEAFVESLKECGISPNAEWIIEGDYTLEGGVAAMEQLLNCRDKPTALLCSNDMTAIGVLQKLYRVDLRIPGDFSVIGFDNIQIGQITAPSLTTIEMSRDALAKAALATLRRQVECPNSSTQKLDFEIQTELVVRESTGFPRGTMLHLRRPLNTKSVPK
jgi:DNA-binding LacI/PurR family transcriptional regulator